MGMQGQIQEFLKRGSNLQRGLDLLILPDNLFIFPDFLKIHNENDFFVSKGV